MSKYDTRERLAHQHTDEHMFPQAHTLQVPESVHDTLASEGQHLDGETQALMEPRFGYSFGHVRIHTDERAAQSAQEINARAYTVGHDVAFAPGQYEPGTQEGRGLLAHELTHVVQHDKEDASTYLQCASRISSPGDSAEIEARTVESQIVSGNAVQSQQIHAQPASTIHLQPVKTVDINIRQPLVIKSNPQVASNLQVFRDKFKNYLQNLRDSNQEACIAFLNTMKSETEETAKADVITAVLKKALSMGKDQIVNAAGEYIPGLEQFVSLYEAAATEVERAEKAEQEVKLVEFINKHILEVGKAIQNLQTQLDGEQGDDMIANLSQAAMDSGDENAFSERIRKIGETLQPPSNTDILRAMAEEFVRSNEASETTGLFGTDYYKTGILFLKYRVDEGETKATLETKVLSGPYAPQIKALLKLTIGPQIDTATLQFTRVIRLEREDLDIMNDIDTVSAGEQMPRPGGLNYFARFVKTMPTLNVDDIKTTKDPVLVD